MERGDAEKREKRRLMGKGLCRGRMKKEGDVLGRVGTRRYAREGGREDAGEEWRGGIM